MQGKATIAGHPVHPMLVTFPIGSYVAAVIADVVYITGGSSFWGTMSMWLIAFGLAGSLLASFFGFVDYLSAPMSDDARKVANLHATLNAGTFIVFGVAFAVRYFSPQSAWGHVVTAVGICLLAAAGILGGSLAHKHLVGSSEGDVETARVAADDDEAFTPTERIAREREKARSVTKGSV
ncbi:MAG TPA: DUF2231 domain-containing protein [Candidatus Baltobacteraceae bacterium]|nr:DUF2231 domain-containing protein [Candidatus Baltobacteraceae bacterium]